MRPRKPPWGTSSSRAGRELVLIAPASADFLARLATGQADDLLTTLCLATEAPIAVAPAMNRVMWANAATRANVATLAAAGDSGVRPGEGDQACGEVGAGRMLEPLELVDRRVTALTRRRASAGAARVDYGGPDA